MRISSLLLLSLVAAVPATAAPESINLRQTVTVAVVEKTKGAVVNISATKLVSQRVSPFGGDPFWQRFDTGGVVRVPADSLGSGFIVHADGYVITNHHVIDRARSVMVELNDGRKLPAELISSDPDADLAVLKIAADKPLPVIDLGDSSDLLIGEPVIAVGNPLGYSHSVSTGIVSAVHRDLKDGRDKVMMADLVQTDAAINPGNSGGPLLNAYAQVIGINTAIRGDAQNIGFAIPVNKLRDLIPELMDPKHVSRIDVPLTLAERRTLTSPAGIACEVLAGGGQGQVIRSIDGKRPANIVDAYALLLRVTSEQKAVSVEFADGKKQSYSIRPAPLPSTVTEAKQRFGITIESLTPMLAEKYSLASEDGLLVTEIARGSNAEKAGLKPGDIIIQLGRYRVSKLDDFGTILRHLPEKGRLSVGLIRGDRVARTLMEF